MTRERSKTKSQTLSVGETVPRLNVSPDSVRNYCERGWLQFFRARGKHRRVLLRSIEVYEAQRRPNKPDAPRLPEPPTQKRQVEEDFEIYYLGNELYPNELNRGYICNLSFFKDLFPDGLNPSTILGDVGRIFGGGSFKILRIRDREVISERIISVPGPSKDDVAIMREVYLDL
jgi:hypothetical protein